MRASALLAILCLPLHASVIGTSRPAEPLTEARVLALPATQRGPWLAYLQRSEAHGKADRAALAREREDKAEVPPLPRQGNSARTIPLHRDPAFYTSDEARHIGDVILSFQTASGGWSKNLDMSGSPRLKGQIYAAANAAPTPAQEGDFDKPRDEKWHYIATLDNDATNTELHFLAELSAALPGHDGDKYRASFLRGVEYLLEAQFPNGGWPQVYPLEGGYHDAITFNDNAVIESVELLTRAAGRARVTSEPTGEEIAFAGSPYASRMGDAGRPHTATEDYTFVPAVLAQRSHAAVEKALGCVLATQVRLPAPEGKGAVLTVWGQQHDPLTLQPVSARNYEPAALSSGESSDILEYLMSLPHPSAAVVRSVEAGVAWLEAHEIEGYVWAGGRGTPGGRKLTAQPGAPPLWARYYSLTTGKPIFGDRDKTIHDDVADISLERRNGYGWYGSGPQAALTEYASWSKTHTGNCGSQAVSTGKAGVPCPS